MPMGCIIFALACALPPPLPQKLPGDRIFRATGTEPGWTLTIDDGVIRYVGDYGDTVMTVPAPRPMMAKVSTIYRTPRLTVTLALYRPCNDGMSDRVYDTVVTLVVDGKTLNGCGQQGIIARDLTGARWRVSSVAGEAVRPLRSNQWRFTEDRLSGGMGCNRLHTSYRIARQFLIAGPVATTKMACGGVAMRQEATLLNAFAAPMRLSVDSRGRLLLRSNRGLIVMTRMR